MSKMLFSRFLLLMGGIFLFHSCVKKRGEVLPEPFNFNLAEGFENSANLPSGWTLYNPDNDAAWQICTTVAYTGKRCLGFNNCSGNGTANMKGRRDRCITASFDFTKATVVSISFDVAYAVLDFKNVIYTDSLALFASTDGGNKWTQIDLKGGEKLSNIPPITVSPPCWEPSASSHWRTDKYKVNNLAGHSNVKFAFENRSDWGEWIYLDNITITASSKASTDCAGITYLKTIQPIMQTQCAIPTCHVQGGTGPTNLTSFAGVKSIADDGSLKKRMMDGNPSFMPTTGKLPDSTLNKVQCWLDAGAPNN